MDMNRPKICPDAKLAGILTTNINKGDTLKPYIVEHSYWKCATCGGEGLPTADIRTPKGETIITGHERATNAFWFHKNQDRY